MSQAQERRKAEAWEEIHGPQHEQDMKEIADMEAQLKELDPVSAEHATLKATYDQRVEAARSFFLKLHES